VTTLVTGATGFVGSAVVRRLLARGEDVRVLTRPTSDHANIKSLPVEIAIGDLCEPDTLIPAVEGCRTLYHVAADYRLWTSQPDLLYQANVDGSRNLIRAAIAAGVERIVYTSSVAVLGRSADGSPADEETPVMLADMIGHYKRSKFLAEEAVRSLISEEGAPVVIVNPSTPIGPRDIKPTPTGRMIVEAAAGRMPAYVDTGLNLAHVDDVAEGHLLAHDRGQIGERYVLGGEDMTLVAILGAIASIVGRRPPGIKLPHNLILPIAVIAEGWARLFNTGEPFVTIDGIRMAKKRMFFRSEKAKRDLNYTARPAENALRDATDWFRANGYLN